MMERFNYNKAVNYASTAFDYGFKQNRVIETAIYASQENETIVPTIMPFDPMPVEKITALFDDVDYAIVEEIGRSKYLSSLQIYQYVNLRGFSVSREIIRKRLNKMMRHKLIREYAIRKEGTVHNLKLYDLDYKGFFIARNRGVIFHKGNQYLSYRKKQVTNQFDTPEDVKRILVGNMIVLGHLMNGVSMERFGLMETIRPTRYQDNVEGSIIRTAANVTLDRESILLYEVVRSTPESLERLEDKVARYYHLIHDERYLNADLYGSQERTIPQLVLCGESYEHCVRIEQHLRSKGLICEEDTLLYTEDLLHLQRTTQTLYALDAEGRRSWYCLPTESVAIGA